MGKKQVSSRSHEELLALTVSEIVAELIVAQRAGKDVNLNKLKGSISSKYGLSSQPKLTDIIAAVPVEHRDVLLPKLKAKPVRTASGIAIVAVMCKPHRCPHINFTGNICVYCPGGPDSDFEYSTQSYTGYEPTSMRAIRARYNPFTQTVNRLTQLEQLGHNVDKVEFIVMGGTFMSLPEDYKDYFIRNLHDALSGYTSSSVDEAVRLSEKSKVKCIGITIETRPDYCLKKHLSEMLSYGCTRLEIGVQSVYEDVARDTNRGHTVKATCESFAWSKDAGFKVVSHMMPDLPNVGIERDIEQFIEFFENPDFRADGLKIYPTLVIRGTGLYELWKTGRYRSYPPNVLVDLIATILALVPPWTRIYRVQRDIPMPLVTSGVEHGNLRELALARMKDFGTKCRDVRTREVGIQEIHNKVRPSHIELIRRDYVANGGWETFISYEDPEQDILVGLLRLRKCAEATTFRPELLGQVSIVRELHVYGSVVPVSARDPTKFQHQGFGQLLMEEAERIALEEHGSRKIAVISGVGTRNYYRKLGYELEGPYMVKQITRIIQGAGMFSLNEYLGRINRMLQSETWDAGTEIAKLLSTAESHVMIPEIQCGEVSRALVRRYMTPPFDQAVTALADQRYEEAYKIQLQLLQTYTKELLQKVKDDNWFIPISYSICTDLRHFARAADQHVQRHGADEEDDATSYYEQSAGPIMEIYRNCVADARGNIEQSKRLCILNLTNQLFRIYFKINKLNLLKPLVRAIDNCGALYEYFSMADKITYKYYTGRRAMFDSDFKLAEESLSFSFKHCPNASRHNKRLILIYLIPVKMFLGHMPTDSLLAHYGLSQFVEVVQAVKQGNLLQLETALNVHERFFIKCGIFLMLEKLKIITYRTLFKKICYILQTHQVPLEAFVAALKFMKVDDVDNAEVACTVANLIYQGKIKGYISHQHQKLVISKQNAFPTLSTISSTPA